MVVDRINNMAGRARLFCGLAVIGLVQVACGEGAGTPEPSAPVPAETTATATAANLETACREAAVRMSGQNAEAIQFAADDDGMATVSWPFDGGRLTLDCTVDGDRVALSYDSRQSTAGFTPPVATPARPEVR